MDGAFTWIDPKTDISIVTIAKYGIMFSPGAVNTMNNPPSIIVGYDKEMGLVAIKPCRDGDEGLTFSERDGYGRVNNKNVIRMIESEMDQNFSETKRYMGKWEDEGGFMIIDLAKPIENKKKKSE